MKKRLRLLASTLAIVLSIAAVAIYASCGGDRDMKVTAIDVNGSSSSPTANTGELLTITAQVAQTTSGCFNPCNVTFTVVDAVGNTVFTQLNVISVNTTLATSITFTPSTSGTHIVYIDAVGSSDPFPANGLMQLAFDLLAPTPTPGVVTPVPTAVPSLKAEPLLAPNPASKGDVVQVYLPAGKNTLSVKATVYNSAGNRVASLSNGLWKTSDAAPGLYLVHLEISYTDGTTEKTVRKVVIK
jgi:hypothetical protein